MNLFAVLATVQPPDTSLYMIVAYGVIFLVTCAYVASLAVRWHRLQAHLNHRPLNANNTGERSARA